MRPNNPMPTKALLALVLLGLWAGPLLAAHGRLMETTRDASLDARVEALVAAGLAAAPNRPLRELTNLQVAQLTAEAVEKRGDAPSQADESLGVLVKEFRAELAAMGVEAAKLEDRIYDAKRRNERFDQTQKKELRQTGTKLSGDARAYFTNYRSFGPHATYGPMDFTDVIYADIRLQSVPVPSILFDLDFRAKRSIGLRYNYEVFTPAYEIRWIALTQSGKNHHFTAGDFWKSYSPLVLWNPDNVFTLTEPTPFLRSRKNLEEFVFLDHGNDWRVRGFEAGADPEWQDAKILNALHAQAMAGLLQGASLANFAQGYFGAQAGADLLGKHLTLRGNGLVIQDDPGSSKLPYIPNLISTHIKRQETGSLVGEALVPLPSDLKLTASGEWAHARYEEWVPGQEILLEDWAILGKGTLEKDDLKLTVKYLNNGPKFYSPGAQTPRTSLVGTSGYLTGNLNLENGLPGYLNNTPLQGLGRPSFAPFDRLAEDILPYGDATPNREALFLGFSGKVGKDGWIQPQLSVALKAKEFQPNYVLTGAGESVLPVDSELNTAVARKFQGMEGAVTLDLAKVVDALPKTCSLSVDFKRQSSDPKIGAEPWTVETLLLGADAGPFRKVPLLGGIVLSVGYRLTQSKGNEYTLNGAGNPPTWAGYSSVLDTAQIGTYSYGPLNLKASSLAFGMRYNITPKFVIHGECFLNKTVWSDVAGYVRRDQIWKLTNELTF